MTTHLTSMLLWETLQTYHGSKDFRCGLMSLDASVSAAILFPPLPPPPPRPIMDQRISGVALCLSMLLCLLPFSSLPSPPPRPIMDQRISGVALCLWVLLCLLSFSSLPFPPPPPPDLSWIKGLRCGLVSLDASVSATILFPPLPPPPRPIMNQRISGVAFCLSMLLCLLPFSSLPSHFMNPLFLRREVTQPSAHSSSKQSVISLFLNC